MGRATGVGSALADTHCASPCNAGEVSRLRGRSRARGLRISCCLNSERAIPHGAVGRDHPGRHGAVAAEVRRALGRLGSHASGVGTGPAGAIRRRTDAAAHRRQESACARRHRIGREHSTGPPGVTSGGSAGSPFIEGLLSVRADRFPINRHYATPGVLPHPFLRRRSDVRTGGIKPCIKPGWLTDRPLSDPEPPRSSHVHPLASARWCRRQRWVRSSALRWGRNIPPRRRQAGRHWLGLVYRFDLDSAFNTLGTGSRDPHQSSTATSRLISPSLETLHPFRQRLCGR